MLDAMQARTCRKHPASEDPFDLTLQRHLIDLDKPVSVLRFGRRAGEAGTRRYLQGAELHSLIDRNIERRDTAGDFVEAGEYCGRIGNLFLRRFADDLIAWLQGSVGRLRRATRLALPGRQAGQRRLAETRRRARWPWQCALLDWSIRLIRLQAGRRRQRLRPNRGLRLDARGGRRLRKGVPEFTIWF